MRRIMGMLLAGAVTVAAAGCAPGMIGFAYHPACSPMQVNAYRSTRIMQTRQQVAQIQAKYSYSRFSPVGVTSKGLVSGECR